MRIRIAFETDAEMYKGRFGGPSLDKADKMLAKAGFANPECVELILLDKEES